jgi:hypothetical protein
MALVHRDGIHHPGHDLRVGIYIRRRDVLVGADQNADLSRVAPGQPLYFAQRQLRRIDGHAAFGAAVGDVDQSTLPGHPQRQGAHLVEVDLRVVANAAFGWAAAKIVLHAIACVDAGGAIIHPDRKIHSEFTLWDAQDSTDTLG